METNTRGSRFTPNVMPLQARRRLALIAILLMLLGIPAFIAWQVRIENQATERLAQAELNTSAALLSNYTGRTLASINTGLVNTQLLVNEVGIDGLRQKQNWQKLWLIAQSLNGAGTVFVYDLLGNTVATSTHFPFASRNATPSDQQCLRDLLVGSDELCVGSAFKDVSTGKYIFPIARTLREQGGKKIGVGQILVSLELINGILQSAALESGRMAGLYRSGDGHLIARSPSNSETPDDSITLPPPGTGDFSDSAIPEFAVLRQVEGWPLLVKTSVDKATMLRDSHKSMPWWLAFAIITMLSTLIFVRRLWMRGLMGKAETSDVDTVVYGSQRLAMERTGKTPGNTFAFQPSGEPDHTLRNVLDAAPVAVSITRLSDNFIAFQNQAFSDLAQRTRPQTMGLDANFFYGDQLELSAIKGKVEQGGVVLNQLCEVRDPENPDSPHSWLMASFMGIEYEGEKCLLAWLYDVSDLKLAQQKAEASNHSKSNFIAAISHEIRTPLNAIIGMSYALGQSKLDNGQLEQLGSIESASRSLMVLINDILDLAKLEAGKIITESSPFSLRQLLGDIDELFAPQARAKGLEFSMRLLQESFPAILEGDARRIRVMLTDLIGNAIKFTQTGGIAVDLEIIQRNDALITLRFNVSDTGIGIAPEAMSTLFQPFSQVLNPTNRPHEGSGLGLSLVKQVAEHLGGQAGARSKPGEGSTFWFELPLSICTGYPSSETNRFGDFLEAEQRGNCPLRGVRVLVADDSESNLQVAQQLLKHEGAQTTLCDSGEAALLELSASATPYDILLIDIKMPGIDGCETARRLREEFDRETLPILALTADATQAQREHAIAAGMNDILTKPIDPIQLIRCIRQYAKQTQCNAPEATQKGGEADTLGDEWPDIAGIDVPAVKDRLAGNLGLFRDLTKRLIIEFEGLLEELEAAVASGKAGVVSKILHRLRGQASNLGAMSLAEEVSRLEMANSQALQFKLEDLAPARAQLEKLTQALAGWHATQRHLADPEKYVTIDTKTLSTLKAQLAQRKPSALRTLRAHSIGLRSLLGDTAFDSLEAAVSAFDFTRAAQLLLDVCAADTFDEKN